MRSIQDVFRYAMQFAFLVKGAVLYHVGVHVRYIEAQRYVTAEESIREVDSVAEWM